MSILGKNWLIKNQDPNKSTFEKLLENRNMKKLDELKDFHDPFLFKDMSIAIERLKKAIAEQERIIIFGDYDVDGISGTALLVHILRQLKANVSFRLPNRMEDGYGLSIKFIDEFVAKDIKLLITVDCGISCVKEIKKASENGIDVIITDHHTIPEQPPDAAFAIIHPKQKGSNYPFSELTGSGVALKLAHALIQSALPQDQQKESFESLIDLASLGTIADLGLLRDENRLIVKRGLKILQNTKWEGLKRLKELANIKDEDEIDTTKIGFQIAPRINAAGRIGDPYTALFLLLEEEAGTKSAFLGSELEKLNKHRQEMTEKAMEEAEQFLTENDKMPYLIMAHSPDWHVGVLGLIAGKLVEKYSRPAIVMQDFGDNFVASARSPEFFNMVEALTHCKEHLLSFGGHAQAAGFNLSKENFSAFEKSIQEYAKLKLENSELKTTLEIDCEINDECIGFELIENMEQIAPFGVGNNRPTFVIRGIEPQFIGQVGRDKKHLKFSTTVKDQQLDVIAFRLGEHAEELRKHRKIDLVCHLEKNIWRDRESIQLQALDFRLIKE